MVGVVGGTIAGHLCQDVRTALSCEALSLEYDGSAALRDHEAITLPVEWARCMLRVVVAGGEGLHGRESRDSDRQHTRFGAACDDRLRVAALDDLDGLADGVRAGRAGRDNRKVWSAGTR